ncbi:MAG: dihydrolipoamide acetyltransferase family protein [Vicinamibacterales bacterium]
MSDFRMPALGADMEAGTLVQWLKRPGDTVARGDIIAVVDTDKGAIEIEVFEDGVLDRTVVEPGQQVPVGTVLAVIRSTSEVGGSAASGPSGSPSSAATLSSTTRTRAEPEPAAGVQGPGSGPPVPEVRPRVSPLARRRAAALGIDVTSVTGTGAHGAVTREDIERAATAHTGADRMVGMRKAIAAAMSRAKRDIPHYYLSATVDLHRALGWLRVENASRPPAERLLPAALLLKAVALALRDVPDLNGHWVDQQFRQAANIHVGVAIALRGGGLVAPAIHDTDALDLAALMRRLQDLVQRARAGSLRSSELTDATVTVTNLGDQGAESTFGIIYPPQVALVGFGRIVERPWVVSGQIVSRSLVTVTLSADHRVTDGHRGGTFLAALDRRLQAPEGL